MESITLVTPPACEPISLADAKSYLRVDGTADDNDIAGMIVSARRTVESITRRALIRQEWLVKRDGFPGFHPLYASHGYPAILLPKPPLLAIVSFQYVDTSGNLQTLDLQTDYGRSTELFYGYELGMGSETQPARLTPPYARPWPPARMVQENVLIDFWAGYCDAQIISIADLYPNVIVGATFPASENGSAIYIPNAGPGNSLLQAVLAVDGEGNGTITPAASQAVSNVVATIGGQVPQELISGIKLQLSYLYSQRGDAYAAAGNQEALGLENLVSYYINRVA